MNKLVKLTLLLTLFSFKIYGQASAANSSITYIDDGLAGLLQQVQVTILDASNMPVQGETVTISDNNNATYSPANTCITDANGNCSVNFTMTMATTAEITATINDGALSNSPQTTTIFPTQEFVANSVVQYSSNTPVVGEPFIITVAAHDVFGNPRTNENVSSDFIITVSGDGSATLNPTYIGNGTYSFTYNPTIVGIHTFELTQDATIGPTSTFNIDAGSIDFNQSITFNSTTVEANGIDTIEFTVNLKDAFENLINGIHNLNFSISGDAILSANSCTTDNFGDCTSSITITNTKAETVVLEASANGNSDFINLVFNGSEIEITGNSQPINDGDTTVTALNNTDFGLNTSSIENDFIIENTGNDLLQITNASITAVDDFEWELLGFNSLPVVVIPGESYVFTIRHNNFLSAENNALVTLLTNDYEESEFTFAIRAGVDNTLGITDIDLENTISIAPNPSNSIFNIYTQNVIDSITIFDVNGKTLKTIHNSNTIDLSLLTRGIYFAKIEANNQVNVKRLILN
ncbi:Ig-like domain-containing protein [Pontimicrobium sp. IMCC45349]|uniref:Ig-like domain-containing protein n=1 Tax=Pontimicrobium sp. IMCC45349 TaxID=3391574 RepID=UPI0039A23F8D